MFLYVFLFTVLSAAAAFGGTYLLLRKTPFAPYSLLLSLVSFQPLLIVIITLLGYRPPVPLRPAYVITPVLAGICLTLLVTVRYRGEIAAALRDTWKSSALIYGLAMASMALATPLLFKSLAYIDWWNGELTNYSYFAHAFLGILRDPNYRAGFEENMFLRYGAELFLAALSAITTEAPLLLVNVLSAFHKAAAIVAFAVSCEVIRKERNLSRAAVIMTDVGFAFATILSLNHVLAFLAAQAVTASFILLSVALLTRAIEARRVQAFLAIQVLFIVITYGEALPFLCGVAGLAFLEAAFQRRTRMLVAVVVIFGAAFIANPFLLVQRLGHLYRLRAVVAGFNVLGNPRDDLVDYLAAALGFRYPFLDVPPLPNVVLIVGIILGLSAIACAFVVAALRLRTVVFLTVPLLLVLMHLDLGVGVQPIGSAYYKSYKAIAALDFYIFLAMVFLLDSLIRTWPWRRFGGVPQALLLAGCVALIVGNTMVSVHAAALIRAVPSVYTDDDIRRALRPYGSRREPVLILADETGAKFWDLMANYHDTPRVLLDRKQAQTVYHAATVVLLEPTALADPAVASLTKQEPATVFNGIIIIPQIVAYSPAPQPVNLQGMLQSSAPGLRLRERDTVYVTPAVRVVNGALINTVNPAAASDGNLNQPPLIVGASPTQGSGSDAILNFAYVDPNGPNDIFTALFNISSGLAGNDCFLSFNRTTNQIGLILDGGTAWDVTVPGSSKMVENSRCTIDGRSSSTLVSGNQFIVRLALKFKPGFAGQKTVFTTVGDYANLTTGWQAVGFWNVP